MSYSGRVIWWHINTNVIGLIFCRVSMSLQWHRKPVWIIHRFLICGKSLNNMTRKSFIDHFKRLAVQYQSLHETFSGSLVGGSRRHGYAHASTCQPSIGGKRKPVQQKQRGLGDHHKSQTNLHIRASAGSYAVRVTSFFSVFCRQWKIYLSARDFTMFAQVNIFQLAYIGGCIFRESIDVVKKKTPNVKTFSGLRLHDE